MPNEEITTRFKCDISDLKKGITEANKAIKLANAEFKAASAGMDDWSSTSDGLSAKLKQLSSVLESQKQKLQSYKSQQEALNKSSEENGRRASELKQKLQELASQGVSKTSAEYKKYKSALDEKMNVPVGVCVATMDVGRPESLLSNFVCDAMLKKANEFMPTDFALTNVGGLRKSISQGEVTLRTVYEVMPFDNRLVLLDLSGHDVLALCDAIALVGGEGVSGITFGIENGKAVGAKIAGKAIDANRIYRLATNDYLSFGNDKMEPLVNSLSVYDTGLQLRDLILESIAELSPVESVLDGRIYEK